MNSDTNPYPNSLSIPYPNLRSGECISADGTHLGHNLPDGTGNRYVRRLRLEPSTSQARPPRYSRV